MLNACTELNMDEVRTLLSKIDVKLPADKLDASVLDSKTIMANVMKRWLPAGEAMLHLIVLHLPSPVEAQIYRIQYLYEGPQDDLVACSMKACDPNGDVMIYISKKIPAQDGSRFLCFGRIFSGTIISGTNVRILGPDYQPGSTTDLQVKNVTNVGIMIGDRCISMNRVPAGNVVALTGIDKCLLKTATITTNSDAHNFRVMKFSVSPVVRVAVDVRDPADHSKLVDGLKKLVQADSLVQVSNENGQQVIAAAGELHLEICLADLEKTHARCPLKVETPIVTHRETIIAESRQTAFTKTTNKHNKFFMRASPLEDGLAEAIESGRISSKQDPKERSRMLVEEFGWDLTATKKIWAFGPHDSGPNILIDSTRSVDGLGNIQDAIVAAFQWVTLEGVLASENLRGVRIELLDAEIHRDSGKRKIIY
jgi:elongation factor 2